MSCILGTENQILNMGEAGDTKSMALVNRTKNGRHFRKRQMEVSEISGVLAERLNKETNRTLASGGQKNLKVACRL